MKTWHRVGLGVAILLALASWIIALYYWGKLPSLIPTHFGWSGKADDWSNKSIFYVFLIPGIQTLMLGFFGFLYWKPQFSDMPTTLWLMALEKSKREHAFDLIRTMLVGISLWIGVLYVYMTYGMNAAALDTSTSLNNWIIFGILGLMLVWLIWWSIKVYFDIKPLILDSDKIGKKKEA